MLRHRPRHLMPQGGASRTANLIGWVVIAILVATWVAFLRPTSLGGPITYTVVEGESMEPTLHDGDFIVTKHQESYKNGDIVVFETTNGAVVHRIRGGSGKEGFVTQGDNNEWTDPWQPRQSDVVGTAMFRVNGLRSVLGFLRSPGKVVALAVGIIMFVGLPSRKGRTRGRRLRTAGYWRPGYFSLGRNGRHALRGSI
ncbi:MAG: signal peptidase I [Actinomycetota bacterium]